MKKTILWTVVGLIVLAALLQVITLMQSYQNPPVVQEPQWDSPQTRALAVRACYDCHSNETTYPWYSKVIPVAWLVQRDVNSGRRRLNFSEWGQGGQRIRELSRVVQEGRMPPSYYTLLHPSAHLSPTETQALIQGFNATFGSLGSGN